MHYWKASLQKRPCGYLNIDCCFVGLLWLHAQLDPDVAAAASGFSQLKEPVRGRVELHQGPHSLHPWRGGPVWEAFLVSQLHINQTEFILDLLIASTNITNYYSNETFKTSKKKISTYPLRVFLRTFMKLRTIRLFAVILLECCSNPPESSLMSACEKAVMNSGKVQMTAPPQMRSGKGVIWILNFCFSQRWYFFFVLVEMFKLWTFLILRGGLLSRRVGHLKSCSTRPGSEHPRLWALPKCFARWETAVMNYHSLETGSHNNTDFAVYPWPCSLCSPKKCSETRFVCFPLCRT